MANRGLSRRQFISAITGGIAAPAAAAVVTAREITPALAEGLQTGPIQLSLASTRTHLTTAEAVELALACAASVDRLALEARHEDGSVIALDVPLGPAGVTRARTIVFPPGLLKPGAYFFVASDGYVAAPAVQLAVHRDEHPNAYFIGAWMQQVPDAPSLVAKGGWMYFTGDLVVAGVRKPGPDDVMERYVAARMKPFSLTVMGGGHQLDMDLTNDWSDPWVQRAVTWKMSLAALSNRLYPSLGLSAFDEPGLTWWPSHGPDGKMTGGNPFTTPVHLQEFLKLTGKAIPTGPLGVTILQYKGMLDAWIDFIGMRLKYLEQAWWATVTAVDQVHAPFITINQLASSYAPGLVTDGVDDRMNRPYRVLNGHAAYSDFSGSWGPVISARAYDGWSWERLHYFLPMWGDFDYPRMRQEVWLPWSTKLEGIEYDPNHEWALSGSCVDATSVFEIAEMNRRLALVGDIMNRMPRTLAPAAVLMSHSQYAHDLATTADPHASPAWKIAYHSDHRAQVMATMWRAMSSGLAPNWLDEYEATEKGAAFLGQWKVIYCPGLTTAKPEFRKALEGYAAAGGKLIQGSADPLRISGSVRVGYAYTGPQAPPEEGVLFNDYALRKYRMALAPGFDADLKGWIGPQSFSSDAPLNAMLMNVQRAGDATYVLMANASQDPDNARHNQMDPIPLETTINVPTDGALYDLLNGRAIAASSGKAPLRLAAGDGACWLHLPTPPGPLKLTVTATDPAFAIDVNVAWGTSGYLPFRLRLFDPAGNMALELFRATTPPRSVPLNDGTPRARAAAAAGVADEKGATIFRQRIALGANAAPGAWTVEAHEWLTGRTTTAQAFVRPGATTAATTVSSAPASVYFDDARKIVELFAGHAREPPFDKMNWDCRRVFGLDAKKFAVYGPDDAATKVAAALRAKGMTVSVNAPYEIVPLKREPDHGGTGPLVDRGTQNFENIYAHTVVLPGHALGRVSWERGHINRPVTQAFPGPGRAYVQWGSGGYQAGFENVWVFGDTATGVSWLLAAIDGKELSGEIKPVTASVHAAAATAARFERRFTVAQEIALWDTPTGIGSSPDGKVIYVLLAGGSVAAYDGAGRQIWNTRALLQGACLAVSPRGDRVAVGGFPGLLVLDSGSGKVLGGYRADPPGREQSLGSSRVLAAAWNSDGTRVAAGGMSDGSTAAKSNGPPVFPLVILDAQGSVAKPVASGAQGIAGNVMGVAFVPQTSTLLVGANQLTAVDATTGTVTWRTDIGGAQALHFSGDGKTGAAGGWGKRAGSFNVSDGKIVVAAGFPSNVGGVALVPGGGVAVAVWGGTHPLYRLRERPRDVASAPGTTKPKPANESKPEAMAQAEFAFHDVLWLEAERALVGAEQGGNLWLIDENGKALARMRDAGTTACRMVARGRELLVGRMNRVVQRVTLG